MVHGTHNAIQDDRNNHIKIYVNGEFFNRKDAKISVFDSGYLVGDGIWEAVRLYRGTLVFLDDHFSRLWSAAKATGIKLPYSKLELKGFCRLDFIVQNDGSPILIEINTIPGMTKESIIPKQLKALGFSLKDFTNIIAAETINNGKDRNFPGIF